MHRPKGGLWAFSVMRQEELTILHIFNISPLAGVWARQERFDMELVATKTIAEDHEHMTLLQGKPDKDCVCCDSTQAKRVRG